MTNNLERFLLYVESKNKDCDGNNDHNNDYMKRRYHRSESDLQSLSKDSFHDDGQQLQYQQQEGCDNDDDHDDSSLLAMAKRLEEECSISSDMCYTRSDKSTRTIEASSTVSTSRRCPIPYTSMSTNTTTTVDNTKINNNNNWRSDRGTLDPVDPEGVLDFNFDTFNKSDPDGIVDDDECYDERGDNKILYSTEGGGILLLDNMAGIRRFHHCHTRNGKNGYGNQRGDIVGAMII